MFIRTILYPLLPAKDVFAANVLVNRSSFNFTLKILPRDRLVGF